MQSPRAKFFRRLVTADPKDVRAQLSLAISYSHLADLLGQADAGNSGRAPEAIETFQRALEILTNTPNPQTRRLWAIFEASALGWNFSGGAAR